MFFNDMSNSGVHGPLQPPIFSAARLLAFLGQDCALCAAPSKGAVVCAACDAALPRAASRCARCALALAHGGICGQCLRRAPSFDAALAAFEYRFPVDRVIRRFKYAGDLALGRWLALALAQRVAAEAPPDLVVAPPLAPPRLRERGFNQALEIAKVVARRVNVPCALDGLKRSRETAPQPGLGRRERLANLRRAFRCELELHGEHVAVVDDVMTSGATAEALARALKSAGAARVSIWAVARTPQPAQPER